MPPEVLKGCCLTWNIKLAVEIMLIKITVFEKYIIETYGKGAIYMHLCEYLQI